MRLRLQDGRRMALGGPGDFLRVRYEEARGAILDAFHRVPWFLGESHLGSNLRDPDLWKFGFPWPHEDGQCLGDIERRELDYRAPTPLFVPMVIARGLRHDDLFLTAWRRDGSFDMRVRVACPHLRARNGIIIDVAWVEVDGQGRPFTVFECALCHRTYTFSRRQVALLRRWNEPDPSGGGERARTLRTILQRLRPHLEGPRAR